MKHIKTTLWILLGTLLLTIPGYTQDTLFYDKAWKECERSEAAYYGFITEQKDGWLQSRFYLSNQQPYSKGHYETLEMRYKTGLWEWWYENGNPEQTRTYQSRKLEGWDKTWYENGEMKSKGKYKNSSRDGLWEFWYSNGTKKLETKYDPDYKPVNFWLPNGEQILKKGNGRIVEFHNDGEKKSEGSVKKYIYHGLWQTWHPNGQKMEEVNFDDAGLATGMHQYWREDGSIEFVGLRNKGKKHGEWQYYNEKGAVTHVLNYDSQKESLDNDVYKIGDREPITLNMDEVKKMIGYPILAQQANLAGQVIVRFLVDKKGNYKKHRIIDYTHEIFTKPVEDQLHNLKFIPAIYRMEPTDFWINIPFNFKLTK